MIHAQSVHAVVPTVSPAAPWKSEFAPPLSFTPRASMVDVESTRYVLDPGFGGHGPLVPLPLVDGLEIHVEKTAIDFQTLTGIETDPDMLREALEEYLS